MTIYFALVGVALLADPEPPDAIPEHPAGVSDHWSFQPLVRPPIPESTRAEGLDHPIDRFIFAGLQAHGIRPAPAAAPAALLRRTFLGVIGLPPTPAQQAEFERIPSRAALDEWVDSLLAHPGYGERWGRHWLDLVRYADSNGYERDSDKPFAWRYRDYVIRSLNEDKPYHQFLREQIAGDSLPELPVDAQVGLGYYLVGPWDDEPANAEQARYDQLDDFAATTSLVYLGIDIGCARCHDHKHDPISQEDYYSFASIFADVRRPVRQGREVMVRLGNAADRDRSQRMLQQLDELQQEILDLRRRLARSLQAASSMEATPAAEGVGETPKGPALSAAPKESSGELTRKLVDLRRRAAEMERELPALPPAYLPSVEGPVEPCHVLIRGDIDRKDKQVDPGLPKHFTLMFPAEGSGPFTRKDLADWLARREHPLVARVLVNRVWQHHFGIGLVSTPNDFGLAGEKPTHPELLDWLAHWFVHEAGGSLKRLHRLILTSETFRMSQMTDAESVSADPHNRLYSRFPRSRLEVEAIHDGILLASGRLNGKMFGPPFYPFLTEEVLRSHESAHRSWLPFSERDASRRAVYAVVKRSLAVPMFEALDRCDPNRSIGRRFSSNGAPQALVALNDEFVVRYSNRLAQRLRREAGESVRSQVELAFRLVLCRRPTPVECEAFVRFWEEDRTERSQQGTADPAQEALAEVCRGIFNLNEFYYPD